MKKSFLIIAALILSTTMLFAQSFEKGNHAINLGIGLANPGYTAKYYAFRPSINASYEAGIVEVAMGSELNGVVGVGGYLGFLPIRNNYWDNSDYYETGIKFIVAVRGTYHFIFHDKLDPYAGIIAGLEIRNYTHHGDMPEGYWTSNHVGPTGGVFVGARWFFTDNFAAYAELGYLISVVNIGVTYKIK